MAVGGSGGADDRLRVHVSQEPKTSHCRLPMSRALCTHRGPDQANSTSNSVVADGRGEQRAMPCWAQAWLGRPGLRHWQPSFRMGGAKRLGSP
jgi:hypothetical protein